MGFFNEMKRRAQFNHIERKKNRIITRQNIGMKIRSIPGEIRTSFDHWKYNFVSDIKEIKNFKGTLRLGIWLSMICIIVVWAFFYGKIQEPILDKIIEYSNVGGNYWVSLTKELAAKVPFIPNFDKILIDLSTPLLGSTVIAWITALISFFCRFIIWCVPAIFLVRHYSKTKGIRSFSRMLRRPFSLRHCWVSFVVMLAWIILSSTTYFISRGKIYFDDFEATKIITTVLSASICEEVLLRGWLLNALNTRGGPVYSSIMVFAFYFLLNLPKWIPTGIFSQPGPLIINLAVSLGFTFCLCMAYNRSRSLWTSIGLRAFWAICNITLPGMF